MATRMVSICAKLLLQLNHVIAFSKQERSSVVGSTDKVRKSGAEPEMLVTGEG